MDMSLINNHVSYQTVLKALEILKRQQEKALSDLEKLKDLKTNALEDPYAFLSDLKQVSKIELVSYAILTVSRNQPKCLDYKK